MTRPANVQAAIDYLSGYYGQVKVKSDEWDEVVSYIESLEGQLEAINTPKTDVGKKIKEVLKENPTASVRTIMRAVGIKSPGHVQNHLKKLRPTPPSTDTTQGE